MSTVERLRSALGRDTLPAVTRERVALSLALAAMAAVRSLPVASVFRPGGVVLSSNDPHYYRHHVEHLARETGGLLDLGAGPALVGAGETGEPLTVAVLWAATELLGGTSAAAGWVLAWYPVVTAVLTGLLVYRIGVVMTADRRVGLAAVLLLAVVPGHAFRTGLGFADHHAMDYLLLALTTAAIVELSAREPALDRRHTWLLAAGLGVGAGGQVLAWTAGGLLLVPAAAGMVPVAAAATGWERPAWGLTPFLVGFGLATVVAGGGHLLLGWQDPVVVAPPPLVLLGAAGLAVVVAVVTRADVPRPGTAVLGASAAGAGLLALVLPAVLPSGVERLRDGATFLLGTTGIAETTSLGAGFGPVVGPLVMLGFAPLLGLPAVVWGLWRAGTRGEVGWAVLAVYVAHFLGLALAQRRFVGELAPPLSVFAGVGFVGLLGWLGVVARPVTAGVAATGSPAGGGRGEDEGLAARDLELPGRRRGVLLGLFGATFAGFPALYTAAIHGRVTIGDAPHRAARFMRQYAAERGWSYPRSYVFSQWGRNRMYNHAVSGEAASYAFARQNFAEFLSARDPAAWYERLRGRVGFVVTTADPPARTGTLGSIHELLHGQWASGSAGAGHYRGVFAAASGRVKVFTLVPGARIVGRGEPGAEVLARTEVSVPDARFEYERPAGVDGDGRFAVRVAQPGEYRVGDRRVTVTERAVREGLTVTVGDAPGE